MLTRLNLRHEYVSTRPQVWEQLDGQITIQSRAQTSTPVRNQVERKIWDILFDGIIEEVPIIIETVLRERLVQNQGRLLSDAY